MKRPYSPPELRRLELEQLTAEQRAWVEEERAKAKMGSLRPATADPDQYRDGEGPSLAADRRRAAGL